MKRLYSTLILFICVVLGITAQTAWVIPQDQKEKLSTVEFTEAMQKSGSDIFSKNCLSCHGTPGQNNPIALNPSPGDPAAEKFQSNSDGSLYYKIREGRVTMPSFKNALSKDEIWSVIAYVRSFNDSYVQEIAEKIETNIPQGTILTLNINYNEDKKAVEVLLTGKLDNTATPIGGVGVKLMAKRYFGNLQIGESKATNKNGIASFIWNEELPGDSLGNVQLITLFEDADIYGDSKAEKSLLIGHANQNPPLNKNRAMWNTVKKAPLWILLGYSGSVITVWFFIFYVLFSMKKIFALGKETISEDQKVL